MIESIKLENFKSHRSTQLKFDDSRLHAIVGQNSSGKTSILKALHYMTQLINIEFDRIFVHENSPQFITTTGFPNMSISLNGYWGSINKKKWQLFCGWKKKYSQWKPTVLLTNHTGQSSNYIVGKSSIIGAPPPISHSLKYSVYLKLIASQFNEAAYSDEVTPQIQEDGSGLAPTLDFIRNEVSDKFQELKAMLKRIVPGVRDLSIRRAKVAIHRQRSIEVNGQFIPYEERQDVTGQEVIFDMNTGDRIPAHAISEGTMLALGLLTVLMHPNQPNLVLLDDIEQGLHPKAQRELMDVLKEILKLNENLQIILSTHSPYIIDELNPAQVHVLNNTHSGFTVAKRLDEHPDIEWAKQTLTTGEFWDAEGEEWVVGSEVSE